jgi:hypothetical protein
MTKTIWGVVGICIVATLAMAVALVVVLSGGDDGPEPEPQAAPLQVGEGQAPGGATPGELEDFRACLEDEGVEPPAPGEAPSGDLGEFQKAVESCREFLPEGAELRLAPFGQGVPQN